MDDISICDICEILRLLELEPEIVQRLDKWGSPYKSQKAHVVLWFEDQDSTGWGAYSRSRANTSARTCFNRLLNPGMLIWIAAVLGADDSIIEQATSAAIEAEKINYRRRCGAFRAVFSFDDVLRLLDSPGGWKFDKALKGMYTIGADKRPHIKPSKEMEVRGVLAEELD